MALPEATNLRYVERYLEKLAARLGCRYKGTVIRGGVEAIRIPALQDKKFLKFFCTFGIATDFGGIGHLLDSKKLYRTFYELGKTYSETGEFNKEIVLKLTQLEMLTKFQFWVFKLVVHNLYWNPQLKKNNAFEKRFDKPYIR